MTDDRGQGCERQEPAKCKCSIVFPIRLGQSRHQGNRTHPLVVNCGEFSFTLSHLPVRLFTVPGFVKGSLFLGLLHGDRDRLRMAEVWRALRDPRQERKVEHDLVKLPVAAP